MNQNMTPSSPTGSSSAFHTSPSLLLRVQADDQGAWTRLVDLYAPLVYHWCRRAQLGTEDTADVFQETFRSVAQHIHDFRRDRPGDTFRGWLRTITQNKIRDHFRRLQNEPKAAGGTDANVRMNAEPDPISLQEDDSEQSVVHQLLHRTLELIRGEFEPRTWQAFWQVQVEGKTTKEVGAELGMTAAAVRKAKLRVLARLRHELGELLE
jgi:RNA polymerase sigma-70 factor, ECF subfamily